MKRNLSRCPNSGCSFSSSKMLSMAIHVGRCKVEPHRKRPCRVGTPPLPPQAERGIPFTLGGLGRRLPLDRCIAGTVPENKDLVHIAGENARLETEVFEEVGVLVRIDEPSADINTEMNNRFVTSLQEVGRKCGPGVLDVMMNVLRCESFQLDAFLSKYPDSRSVQQSTAVVEDVTCSFNRNGFDELVLSSAGEPGKICYSRDLVALLRSQLRSVPTGDILHDPERTVVGTHPINAVLGREGMTAVKKFIQRDPCSETRWRSMASDGQQSIVLMLQVYSDKSVTSTKPSGVTFYPIHVTIMNFTEGYRRRQITSGRSLLAFLPCGETTGGMSLPGTVDEVLKAIREYARKGFPGTDGSGVTWHCHLAIGSYCADIPEAKDLLSILHGTKTTLPCHRCLAKRAEFSSSTRSRNRDLTHTMRTLERSRSMVHTANTRESRKLTKGGELLLKQNSLRNVNPVLHDFPFVGLVPCLDIHAIFSFEPMHNFSLGISKTIKFAALERLRTKELSTVALGGIRGAPKQFRSVRRLVSKEMNYFLRYVTTASVGYGIDVDFSIKGSNAELNGFFKDDGIAGMLEAKDFSNIDQVSPFLGAMMDLYCGEGLNAPVTTTFVMYVDLLRLVWRRGGVFAWDDKTLGYVTKAIEEFKEAGAKVFGRYQKSGMGTMKWHLLDHIVEDIRRLGGLEYGDANLYEHAHRIFKDKYKLTSRRRKTAVRETVQRLSTLEMDHTEPDSWKQRGIECSLSGKRGYAARGDTAYLAKDGFNISLSDLIAYTNKPLVRSTSPSHYAEAPVSYPSLKVRLDQTSAEGGRQTRGRVFKDAMLEMLGEEKLETLKTLILDTLGISATHRSTSSAGSVRVHFSASAFICGYDAPRLSDCSQRRGGASVEIGKSRLSQKIVAVPSYYGSVTPKLDDIMVEDGETKRGVALNGRIPVWFGRLCALVQLESTGKCRPGTQLCIAHNERDCISCKPGVLGDYCFIQYFDVMGSNKLHVDGIDKSLDCIRLSWAIAAGDGVDDDARMQYGLCPLDSIRGLVHLVRKDAMVRALVVPEHHGAAADARACTHGAGTGGIYYVNRFYTGRAIAFEYEDE